MENLTSKKETKSERGKYHELRWKNASINSYYSEVLQIINKFEFEHPEFYIEREQIFPSFNIILQHRDKNTKPRFWLEVCFGISYIEKYGYKDVTFYFINKPSFIQDSKKTALKNKWGNDYTIVKSPIKGIGGELVYKEGEIPMSYHKKRWGLDESGQFHKVYEAYKAYTISTEKLIDGVKLLKFLLSKKSEIVTLLSEPIKLRDVCKYEACGGNTFLHTMDKIFDEIGFENYWKEKNDRYIQEIIDRRNITK
jgi:hypothetical protein